MAAYPRPDAGARSTASTQRSSRPSPTPGGPLLVVGAAGHGQDVARWLERFAWLVGAGLPARAVLALCAPARGGRPARARWSTSLERPHEELRGGALRRAVRAAAARRGARGRPRPVLRAASRRPTALALLLDRIDELHAAPPRDPRQPGAADRAVRPPHRPAEGRDDRRRATTSPTRSSWPPPRRRRRARARRPRARVRARVRRPRRAARRARRARLRRRRARTRSRLLHEKPHVRERAGRALPRTSLVDEPQETRFAGACSCSAAAQASAAS